METGIQGTRELVVEKKHTAREIGSGELDVLATPELIALAEETAGTKTIRIIATSEYIKDSIIKKYGTSANKIDVIYSYSSKEFINFYS